VRPVHDQTLQLWHGNGVRIVLQKCRYGVTKKQDYKSVQTVQQQCNNGVTIIPRRA
jgi:hypothetical protein